MIYSMKEKNKISWMSLRYENEQHNIYTQIGVAFIMGCILIGTIIYKNYLLGVIVIISAVLMKYIKKNESEYIPIDIDNNGISINNEMILYDKISAFYIDKQEEGNYLLIKFKNTFNTSKVIIIEPEVNIEELRTFLHQHIIEKEIKQLSIDKLMNSF